MWYVLLSLWWYKLQGFFFKQSFVLFLALSLSPLGFVVDIGSFPQMSWVRCWVAQWCPTLCDPIDYSLPGFSVLGILQAGVLSVLPFPSPGDLPDPGIEPVALASPALAGGFFTTSAILLFNHSVTSDSLWPHGLQHTRLPCPSPSCGACSNSCPSNWCCHPTSYPLSSPSPPAFSLPASGSFQMSQFFASSC